MNSKKYGITFITLFILGICFCLVFNALIDPFFHYHKPLKRLNYELDIHDQRYINDGIVKNFTYNAIITGSSVTDNFKTSEFNKLFNVNSIKVPLSGSYFKEVNDLLTNAFKYNKNIKYVLRSVEYSNFYRDKDAIRYEINTYPTYLMILSLMMLNIY